MKYRTILVAVLFLNVMQQAAAFDKNEFVRDVEHAKALFAEGKQREAIAFWEKLKPKYGHAQGHYENELGNFYSNARIYDKAEKAYLDGIALKGKYPRLYAGLAIVFYDQKRFPDAEKWAKRAVEEFPNWWLGYYTLGLIEWRQDNFVSAKAWLTRSLTVEPQAQTFWLLSIVSYELKDYQTTVSVMESAINLDKKYLGDKNGMKVTAVSLAQVGRYKDAYAAVETLKKNNPEVKEAEIRAVLNDIRILENQHANSPRR